MDPESKRTVVSKLKIPEEDRAFLREAIDFLSAKRVSDNSLDRFLNGPPDQPLVRLRKRGWEIDDWLGIRHYKFDRGRQCDSVTVPTLPDCHCTGDSV